MEDLNKATEEGRLIQSLDKNSIEEANLLDMPADQLEKLLFLSRLVDRAGEEDTRR